MPAKRSNGPRSNTETTTSIAAMMQGPAANSFLLSQRMALEAARFWARRLHAYADQMEALACCSSADEVAAAQTRFLERMRDDYAHESEAIGELMTPPGRSGRRRAPAAEEGA
jgi:hypothetical protein